MAGEGASGLSLFWPELAGSSLPPAAAGTAPPDLQASDPEPLDAALPPEAQQLMLWTEPEPAWDPEPSVDNLINDAAYQYLQSSGGAAVGGAPPDDSTSVPSWSGGPPPGMTFDSKAVGMEPKTALNCFLQKFCKRPISKTDVVYTVNALYGGRYQASVKLDCLNGEEYAGEVCRDRKAAEKSAAEQALHFHASTVNALLPAGGGGGTSSKNKTGTRATHIIHRNTPASMASLAAASSEAIVPFSPAQPTPLPTAPGGQNGSAPVGANLLPPGVTVPGAPETGENRKAALNIALSKLLRRQLNKEDIIYETAPMSWGYQTVLKLPCLPGVHAMQTFVGEVVAKKKDSEASAAGAALTNIMMDPELGTIVQTAKPAQWKGGGKGGIKMQQNRLTGAAPKTCLSIMYEDRCIGSVEISPATSLASVRVLINTTFGRSKPEGSWLFSPGGVPTPQEQEGTIVATSCLPQIVIVSEELKRRQRRSKREHSPSPCSPRPLRHRTSHNERGPAQRRRESELPFLS